MLRFLSTCPLAGAGVGAVAGVLAADAFGGIAAVVAAAALAFTVSLRAIRPAAVALLPTVAAVAAGCLAGGRPAPVHEAAPGACTARMDGRPRAPPPPAQCELIVTRCDEDPVRGRAWLEGRVTAPKGPGRSSGRSSGRSWGRDWGRGRRRDRRTRAAAGVFAAWPGRAPDGLAPGARVRVVGRFFRPRGAGNPGERDGRVHLARRGVAWIVDLKTASNVAILADAPPGPRRAIAGLRRRAARRLQARLPPDVAPIGLALLLGVRGGVDPVDTERFARTGTLHLLAISGMHLLLLAGMVHALLRRAGCGPRGAAAVTLLLVCVYVPLTGSAAPVRRAATVLVFYGVALACGRPPDAWSALGGAALVLALTHPHDVFTVGFRLSFVAVAGIAWLAACWQARWGRRERLWARFPAFRDDHPVRVRVMRYLFVSLPVSVAAWLATQGLVADAFGRVTPWAAFTSVVAAPFVAVLLPLLALVAFGAPGGAGPATALVRALRRVLDGAGVLPAGVLSVPEVPFAVVIAWCGGVVLLRHRPRLAVAALGVAAVAGFARPAARGAALVLLDVGHGQAALLRFRDGRSVLVDGGSSTRRDVGRRVIVPALRALGVRRLDAVVCTHADADHWNGLAVVLARVPVGFVGTGRDPPGALVAAARAAGVPVRRLRGGSVVTPGVVVLAGGGAAASRNDASVALLFTAHGRRVLLPADREDAGLAQLVGRGVPPCDILVAPHHGSACGAAWALGMAVRPRWLLVSASHGRPDEATLSGYAAPRILRTDRSGCITARITRGGALRITTFR